MDPALFVMAAVILGGVAAMNIAKAERPGVALGEFLQGLLMVAVLVGIVATLVMTGWKFVVWVWS